MHVQKPIVVPNDWVFIDLFSDDNENEDSSDADGEKEKEQIDGASKERTTPCSPPSGADT